MSVEAVSDAIGPVNDCAGFARWECTTTFNGTDTSGQHTFTDCSVIAVLEG